MHQHPSYIVEDGQKVSVGTGLRIVWQEGSFMDNGPNGSMLEQPVRALLHRIAELQAERPCAQNPEIVQHLQMVLRLLDDRTRERNARGVLGTAAV